MRPFAIAYRLGLDGLEQRFSPYAVRAAQEYAVVASALLPEETTLPTRLPWLFWNTVDTGSGEHDVIAPRRAEDEVKEW